MKNPYPYFFESKIPYIINMSFLPKNIKPYLPKPGVFLLLISFGIMTLFSSVLHAHELDFGSAHDECAPCHWSQSTEGVETDASRSETPFYRQSFQLIPVVRITSAFLNQLYNRGPPLSS